MERVGSTRVEGHRIGFARYGSGADVALLHGIPTNRTLWHSVAPILFNAGVGVLALDLLGYGTSDKPEAADLGLAAQARIMAAAIRQIGWGRGILVGHDIGGGVVQLMAIADPTMVSGLVLIDTIAYDSFPEPGIARLKDPVWDGIFEDPAFSLAKGFAKAFSRGLVDADRVTPGLLQRYEAPFAGLAGRLAYLRAARALRTEELNEKMEQVEQIAQPTLIIWGEEDAFQSPRYGMRLAAAMPDARFELVERAGHFLPEEAPADVARRILRMVRLTAPEPGHRSRH